MDVAGLVHARRALSSCATTLLALLAACALGCAEGVEIEYGGPTADWPEYGGSKAGSRYSPLTQITRDNVAALELAWEYHTGDFSDGSTTKLPTSFQNTPIVVDDTLYVCTPRNRVVALDPETGAERWVYDSKQDTEGAYILTCRGVSYWADPAPVAGRACQKRIFMGTLDARMIALDADTGRPCLDFGERGAIDLKHGLGDTYPGEYGVTSPPAIVGDRLITGALVLDNIRTDAPGGVVRAYDVRTGDLLWAWDPVAPGARRVATRDGSIRYERGTTNAWSIFSVDPERELVFVPTGNTSPDYYGGHREGSDYYSSSVIALDARSGRVVWHFQTVHHDIWDYDVPSQPLLFDWPGPDGPVPALAQATKMGHIFFLDRETGEPIFPVEERPVPQGALPGEVLSPTQPFPTRPAPIHPATLTPDDAFGFTPWDRASCRARIESLRSDGIFSPASERGTVHFPGMVGGSNWGSLSLDPVRGILVANSTRVANWVKMVPRRDYEAAIQRGEGADAGEPALGTPYAVQREILRSPLGAPCNPPPWGVLTAIDVARGEQLWEVPLGSTRDLAPFPFWLELGVPNQGGSTTTASGIIFVAATTDDYLRAFDVETGRKLWQQRLPAGGQATPLTYRLRADSKQYVVVAAGGHGLLGTTLGDSVLAYALP